MKFILIISILVSFKTMALTLKPGHYLGTLELNNKATGSTCHVQVESETANSSGEGCFDYIVTSKELGVEKLNLSMRRDVIMGNGLAKCSKFVLPSYETNKLKSYITDFDETLNLLVNIKTGFLREKVMNCKNLVYIKDN